MSAEGTHAMESKTLAVLGIGDDLSRVLENNDPLSVSTSIQSLTDQDNPSGTSW
jgi:hypothetical protein